MKDGRLNCCRSCSKLYHNTNNRRAHRVAYMAKYKASDKYKKYLQSEENRAAKKRWQDSNKHKVKAHDALNYAVKTNRIKVEPCEVCGATVKIQGHHSDYSKPLDVNWLCKKHHNELHYGPKLVAHTDQQVG